MVTKKFNNIQFLRAFAVLGVLYVHLFHGYVEKIIGTHHPFNDFFKSFILSPLHIKNTGNLGVVVFFLISGFIITLVSFRESRFEFGLKRFFRLFPPIFVSLLFVSFLYICFILLDSRYIIDQFSEKWPFIASTDELSLKLFLQNLTLIKINLEPVLWTLRIEIAFYLFIFVFLHYLKKSAEKLYLLTGIIFIILLILHSFSLLDNMIYKGIIIYMPFLFLGSLLFLYEYKKIPFRTFSFLSILFTLFLYIENPLFNNLYIAFLLLYAGIKTEGKIKIPEFLILYGDMSYSVYLIHLTSGLVLMYLLISTFGYSDLMFALYFFITVSLVSILSYLSFMYIEKPSQKLARNIISSLKSKELSVVLKKILPSKDISI